MEKVAAFKSEQSVVVPGSAAARVAEISVEEIVDFRSKHGLVADPTHRVALRQQRKQAWLKFTAASSSRLLMRNAGAHLGH